MAIFKKVLVLAWCGCMRPVEAVAQSVGYAPWKSDADSDKNTLKFQANGTYFFNRHNQVIAYADYLMHHMRVHRQDGALGGAMMNWALGVGYNEYRLRDPFGNMLVSGTGSCTVGPDEFYRTTPCHAGHGPFLVQTRTKPPQFLCPADVPISILAFPKVMSTSLHRWGAGMDVEEKFGEQIFRVLSEMRIWGKNRVAILDFGRVSLFFSEIWREIGF